MLGRRSRRVHVMIDGRVLHLRIYPGRAGRKFERGRRVRRPRRRGGAGDGVRPRQPLRYVIFIEFISCKKGDLHRQFGKLVNSRGPLIRNDSDDELAPGGRRTGGAMPGMLTPHGWAPAPWQQQMGTGMSSMSPTPQFNDQAFVAAHQRAMMYAKQAYQMAVAQHAIAVAGDEWERGSNAGFGSGGSAYGGSSASVYGGGGMAIGPPGPGMGMMGMPNMGMLMPPGQWHSGPVMFPSTASIYGSGIGSTQSEFGGAGGWASKSAYGDSFGPSPRSSYLHAGHGSAASAYGGSAPRPGPTPRQRAQTGVAPPSSTSSRSPGRSRVPPPSSWKNAK